MPRPTVIVVVVAALLLGAGCTETVTGSATPLGAAPPLPNATTTPDAVTWVDDVCGALLPFIQTTSTPPQLGSSGNLATTVQEISDYFGQAGTSAGAAIAGMAAAGPSPVAGGDAVVARLTRALMTFQTLFGEAQERIDAIDRTDPQSLATGLPAAIEPLLANLPDPTTDLRDNPELDRAAEQAPNCQQIESEFG